MKPRDLYIIITTVLVTTVFIAFGTFLYGYYANWDLPFIGSRITNNESKDTIDNENQSNTVNEDKNTSENQPNTNSENIQPEVSEFKTYSSKNLGITFSYKYKTYFVKEEKDRVLVNYYQYDKYKNGPKKLETILTMQKGKMPIIPAESLTPKAQMLWPKTVNVLGKVINLSEVNSIDGGGGSISGIVSASGQITTTLYIVFDSKTAITEKLNSSWCEESWITADEKQECLNNVAKSKAMDYQATDANRKDAISIVESIKLIK